MNSGGPVFPTPRYERGDMYSLGMDLRDYFAAVALRGLLEAAAQCSGTRSAELLKNAPGAAFHIADQMLEARSA